MAAPGFWDNQEQAQGLIQGLKSAKATVDALDKMSAEIADIGELAALIETEKDPKQEDELRASVHALEERFERLELETLLSGPNDHAVAMMSIQAGNGGTDASDFAEMLLRMYMRWGEARGYKTEILELSGDDVAGIRSALVRFQGDHAFGWLRAEIGVHRLIRISPFNAAGKRQTSFAAVDVLPELEDDGEIEVKDADLRIVVYRAGGKGGQLVNTTDSAVRITHLPSGIVVQCQNERSQHKNKASAMKVLKSRLARMKEMEREKEMAKSYGEKGEIAFGSQIRTYTLQPYQLVKDHRTDVETAMPQKVLDGALDPFMEAYLKMRAKEGQKK
jgi:peptide chain release factor 2